MAALFFVSEDFVKPRGFTIIELVVVIIVVGVLAVTALPRFFNRDDYDLRGFHDKALGTLQFARKAAVAARHHVCVTVNSAASPPNLSFDISTTDPDSINGFPANCGANPLRLPFKDGDCGGATNAVCAPDGVTFSSAQFPNGTVLIFDPAGRASLGGVLNLSAGDDSYAITVEQETGYAR
jgi:MSHA pilin protein MshC